MSVAETLACAELRTRLALQQINLLKRGDHTHDHPEKILSEIAENLDASLDELKRALLTGNSDIVRSRAADLIIDLDTYLPLLGFILRSSNVRNAFEVFDPLIALCSALLGSDVRLIYSSEWDYSPFTRTFIFPKLQNVVVVGLPAHESGNALIVPVVGHELGHAKWKRADLLSREGPKIEKDVIAYFLRHLDDIVLKKSLASDIRAHAQPEVMLAVVIPEVAHAQYFAKLQCEEVFCDIVGTRIFGASYLRAFAYLIFPSPKSQERRNFEYPGNNARVRYMKEASAHFGASAPSAFGDDFDDMLPRDLVGARRHMILAADAATEAAFPRLLSEVGNLIPEALVPFVDEAAVSAIADAFAKGQPADGKFALPDIVAGAWQSHLKSIDSDGEDLFRRLSALNEVVYKTIEVSEFYRRTGG